MSLKSLLNNTDPKAEYLKVNEQDKALAEKEQQKYTSQDSNADTQAQLAQLKINQAQKNLDIQVAHLEGIKQDQELRDTYAKKAYGFVKVWSMGLFILLLFSGLGEFSILGLKITFSLTDSVLIALITGVTVNILAAFLTVINNLFPTPKKTTQPQKQTTRKSINNKN